MTPYWSYIDLLAGKLSRCVVKIRWTHPHAQHGQRYKEWSPSEINILIQLGETTDLL